MVLKTALKKTAVCLAAGAALGMAAETAQALTIAPINSTTGIANTLTTALSAPGNGISVVGGSATYQGVNTATLQQSGTYSGFSLAPSSGSTPTLSIANGILLTSGSAALPLTNTAHPFSNQTGSGANTPLTTLAGTGTLDANVLSFNFNVAPTFNSVSAQFLFGTEEFPTQSVTDIFGFFVDGVNYAKFSNGQLISNTPGSPTNFINNSTGLYGIEYDGLTKVFSVTGLLGKPNADGSHTLTIGVADTNDDIYDSGVFISSLAAGVNSGGGGGIDVSPVPEPETYALMMAGLALVGAVARRRKQKAG